ncbi:MAG: pseudouridine synthase [Bdellovibrionales bacterium]
MAESRGGPEGFRCIYQDDDLVAIVKPSGLLVHRTALALQETQFALQMVRDWLGQAVYPVHRLDRPTSGLLLMARSSEMAQKLSLQFANQKVFKNYYAVVRGVPPASALINYPLKEEWDRLGDAGVNPDKPEQPALTEIETLACVEFPVRVDRYPTSRYALVRARPRTGRRHQIRRHLRHLGHPIVGDVNHGVGKHNRFFASTFGVQRLLLACTEMAFEHPRTQEPLQLFAPPCPDFHQVLKALAWQDCVGPSWTRETIF